MSEEGLDRRAIAQAVLRELGAVEVQADGDVSLGGVRQGLDHPPVRENISGHVDREAGRGDLADVHSFQVFLRSIVNLGAASGRLRRGRARRRGLQGQRRHHYNEGKSLRQGAPQNQYNR